MALLPAFQPIAAANRSTAAASSTCTNPMRANAACLRFIPNVSEARQRQTQKRHRSLAPAVAAAPTLSPHSPTSRTNKVRHAPQHLHGRRRLAAVCVGLRAHRTRQGSQASTIEPDCTSWPYHCLPGPKLQALQRSRPFLTNRIPANPGDPAGLSRPQLFFSPYLLYPLSAAC